MEVNCLESIPETRLDWETFRVVASAVGPTRDLEFRWASKVIHLVG